MVIVTKITQGCSDTCYIYSAEVSLDCLPSHSRQTRAAETSKLSTTHLWSFPEVGKTHIRSKRNCEGVWKCERKNRITVEIQWKATEKQRKKTSVEDEMEMETEGDKDDSGVKGFKVNLLSCFPRSDQQRWIKKESASKEEKALLTETLLLIILFTSAGNNKQHPRAQCQSKDRLS